jgi:hypothetical protein
MTQVLALAAEISASSAKWEWLDGFPRSARWAHAAMQQRAERFWLLKPGF